MTKISPGDVISRAAQIYRSQFGILIAAALIVFLISAVATGLLPGVLAIIAAIIGIVAAIFYQGMVVQLVRDVQDGRRDYSLGELFASVKPVAWPLFLVSLLAGIGIAIGFVLLIIPGLILLTIWSVVGPATVIEKPGVIAAFGRSRELVRHNGWQVFGVIVLVYLIVIAFSIVGGIIASPLGEVGEAIVSWIVTSLTAPFAALSAAVLYYRLRDVKGEAPADTTVTRPEGTAGLTGTA